MTTPAKRAANRRNALRSTGPRTPAGKDRAAANSFRTGLFARIAVIPGFGETADGFEEFRAAVTADLDPVGAVEAELTDRAALIFWRLRRVAAYEATLAGATTLPPDPDDIVPRSTLTLKRPPLTAPHADHLAFVRAALHTTRISIDLARSAIALLDARSGKAGDEPLDWRVASKVTMAADDLFGYPWGSRPDPWAAAGVAAGGVLAEGGMVAWTPAVLRRALDRTAAEFGRPAVAFRRAVREQVREEISHREKGLAAEAEEERRLVAAMVADRVRAAAAAVYADEASIHRVARAEGHLGRELARTLELLDRLRAARPGPTVRIVGTTDGPAGGGFVLPAGRIPGARLTAGTGG